MYCGLTVSGCKQRGLLSVSSCLQSGCSACLVVHWEVLKYLALSGHALTSSALSKHPSAQL